MGDLDPLRPEGKSATRWSPPILEPWQLVRPVGRRTAPPESEGRIGSYVSQVWDRGLLDSFDNGYSADGGFTSLQRPNNCGPCWLFYPERVAVNLPVLGFVARGFQARYTQDMAAIARRLLSQRVEPKGSGSGLCGL